MSLTTYDGIVSGVQAAAEDTGSEFTAYIPTALELAQLRLFRDLDTYGYVVFASDNMTAGSPFLTKPTGTFIVKSLAYTDSTGAQQNLLMRTDEFIRDFWPIRSSVASSVLYYAPYGYDRVILGPTPVSAFPVEWSLITMPSAVSVSAQSNWFTTNATEGLFYATMVEQMIFAKNPTMKAQWEERYQDAKSLLRNEARRTRRDDQNAPDSPAGGDNNFNPATPAAVND